MPLVIRDTLTGTPSAEQVGYDELPRAVVAEMSRNGDPDAAAWLAAHPEGTSASALVAALRGVVALYSDDQPRDDHGRWTSGGGDETSAAPTAESTARLATQLLDAARAHEPEVTSDLKTEVAETDHGAQLAGLDFRVKTESSLDRKIASDAIEKNTTPQVAASEIHDVLRYTQTTGPEHYTQSVVSTARELQNRGYTLDKVKNTWDSTTYRGLNTQWHAPDGQHFELQFHTPQSFEIKNDESPGGLHALYEEARSTSTSDARRAEVTAQMDAITSQVVVPVGAPSLTYAVLAA